MKPRHSRVLKMASGAISHRRRSLSASAGMAALGLAWFESRVFGAISMLPAAVHHPKAG